MRYLLFGILYVAIYLGAGVALDAHPTARMLVANTLLLALAGGIWAVWRRVFPVACAALGAYSNELVRAANGGHMPVEGYRRMLEGFGVPSDTYTAAGAATNFAWLDDRFQLPPPFPGIASVGDILIALGMAWLVAALVARRRAGPVSDAAGDALDAPPSDASAA